MLSIYRFLTSFFYPFLVILIYFRMILKKEDNLRYKEKIFPGYFNPRKNKIKKLIWFHAASVGELKSVLPIIKKINIDNKNLEILITTVTLSSANLAKDEIKEYDNVYHRFFPLDVTFLIKKFIKLWKPSKIFLVDSEIWPNLILISKNYNIPISILNARITFKTYKKWIAVPNTAKIIFSSFNLCLTSNEETKKYLLNLNAKNVIYIGNIKFITPKYEKKFNSFNLDKLSNKKIWIAASTHDGEEEICIKAHLKLKEKFNEIITIIAPRHINRVEDIKKIFENYDLKCKILNKNQSFDEANEIFIINFFGSLPYFYKYASSVFVGKSTIKKLIKDGGQNPIDAVRMGCKIYHGPYFYNFQEIYEFLIKNNISKVVWNSDELFNYLKDDLENNKKNIGQFSKLIDSIGEKTFDETMKKINKFLDVETF